MGRCEVVAVAVGGHFDCDPLCMMPHEKALGLLLLHGVSVILGTWERRWIDTTKTVRGGWHRFLGYR
jgi:hypothetical protein